MSLFIRAYFFFVSKRRSTGLSLRPNSPFSPIYRPKPQAKLPKKPIPFRAFRNTTINSNWLIVNTKLNIIWQIMVEIKRVKKQHLL